MKVIRIGVALEESVKTSLIVMLQEFVDIFVWSYQDMPGLDINIVVHRSPLKEECPPCQVEASKNAPRYVHEDQR